MEDEENPDSDSSGDELATFPKKPKKNPLVDTSFLPDRQRETKDREVPRAPISPPFFWFSVISWVHRRLSLHSIINFVLVYSGLIFD